MRGQIIISYRREESRWSARSLRDRLGRDFETKQIFMDVDSIAYGADFVKAIETTIAKCDVLVAVIGNNWLTSKDVLGNRRLDRPEDFVRMEIGTALKREICVIPVLLDGASMPSDADLPEDLRPLVRRPALRVTDTTFEGDCQRLTAAITRILQKTKGKERESMTSAPLQGIEPTQAKVSHVRTKDRKKQKPFLLAFLVLIVIVGGIWFVGSKLNYGGQKATLAIQTPQSTAIPEPTATPSSASTPMFTPKPPPPSTPKPTPSSTSTPKSTPTPPGTPVTLRGELVDHARRELVGLTVSVASGSYKSAPVVTCPQGSFSIKFQRAPDTPPYNLEIYQNGTCLKGVPIRRRPWNKTFSEEKNGQIDLQNIDIDL